MTTQITQTQNSVEIEKLVVAVPDQARSILVTDDKSYAAAGEILLKIKDFQKEIDSSYDPIITRAYDLHKESIAQKKRVEAPLLEAEAILKPKMSEYIKEAPEPPKVSGITSKKTWKFKITNQELIPREYLIPDEKTLGQIARTLCENATVPGVEFYFDLTISAGRR
ncbi:MAG: hypothetical protein JNK65_07925 [Deltaproteobacteria bacterium]|nr:hypothetical protein [Deltaproteobacteria bacterium]